MKIFQRTHKPRKARPALSPTFPETHGRHVFAAGSPEISSGAILAGSSPYWPVIEKNNKKTRN